MARRGGRGNRVGLLKLEMPANVVQDSNGAHKSDINQNPYRPSFQDCDALVWVLQQVIFEPGRAKDHRWSIITTASRAALHMAPQLPQSASDPLFVFDAPNWIFRSIYDDQ